MIGIILRSVLIIGVVFQYSLSVFNTIDKYFSEQFKKYHDLRSNKTQIVEKNITVNLTMESANKKIQMDDQTCLKPTFFDYFINYCPAVKL